MLTVSGRYEYRTDAESLELVGDRPCFFPGTQSAKLLPHSVFDIQRAWFCFTNADEARRQLGLAGPNGKPGCGYLGEGTVQIAGYKPYQGEGDGYNLATLVTVVRASRPKTLPCR